MKRSTKAILPKKLGALAAGMLVTTTLVVVAPFLATSASATPAAFTGVDPGFVGSQFTTAAGACLNGNPNQTINCNLYAAKTDVFLNAGPAGAVLGAGNYFFSVLVPGGQNDPNDATAKNLSDMTCAPYTCPATNADGSSIPSGDLWTNREFTVNGLGGVTYSGTHDFDSGNGKIRVMPFDDTTNGGGVYILAICKVPDTISLVNPPGVVSSSCKKDAFKVSKSGSTCQVDCTVKANSVFTGTKWLDPDGDGEFQPTETGLQNWTIDITQLDGSGNAAHTDTVPTDSSGGWSYTTPDLTGTGTTTFQVCEETQTQWNQTGPDATDASTANGTQVGGASASLATPPPVADGNTIGSDCYDVTVPNDADSSVGSLDFFNQPTGTISGLKYYDALHAGTYTNQPLIGGWEVAVTNNATSASQIVDTASFGPNTGTFSLSGLTPGTYTVKEVQATNGGWTQTGNTANQSTALPSGDALSTLSNFVYTVTVAPDQPSTITGLDFGNVCVIHNTNGLTLGFWSNKNGQKILKADWANVANLINSTLYLVNADGSRFLVSTTATTGASQLNNWLLSATSKNASYMLSVQLLTTQLDINYNGLAGGDMVQDPVSGMWVTISSLINQVGNSTNGFIKTNPNTTSSGTARTDAVAYQTLFNAINNNQASVTPPGPGGCPTPIFP